MPLVAFPWGSPSMRSVLCSAAARLAARLTAVVVLPTPPFWFAMAMTRATCPEAEIPRRARARHGRLSVFVACSRPIYGYWNQATMCHVERDAEDGATAVFHVAHAAFTELSRIKAPANHHICRDGLLSGLDGRGDCGFRGHLHASVDHDRAWRRRSRQKHKDLAQ